MTQGYTYHVKNMVCRRCILIVTDILDSLEIKASVSAGKIKVNEKLPTAIQDELSKKLSKVGLEIIESRVKRLIEEVKFTVLEYLSLGYETQRFKLSGYISTKLSYDFTYLSELFSKSEGITIERYFILQRLEKVKELIAYDQLSLSEIAFETGFSSVHHLSSQFKKILGVTPSQYKSKAVNHRISLDLVSVLYL